ncbi:hypothetical protein Pint_17954 [Pistacia integerrima]|uniref:Uncharacterized protein n=1 Tax=Pistacia integerrima TaxID=434235 RepID=A0ACC0Z0Y9_9ROSI|nr:hypothetical protein Pint_17954 [Pistacia integerrima]
MAKVIASSKAVMMALVFAAFAMAAATVSAQSSELAPAPPPSLDTGAAFSLPVPGSIIGFSLVLSLLALLKH